MRLLTNYRGRQDAIQLVHSAVTADARAAQEGTGGGRSNQRQRQRCSEQPWQDVVACDRIRIGIFKTSTCFVKSKHL